MGYRLHCPYCISIITEDTVLCPVCGKDTLADAAIEMTVEEYDLEERQPCEHCGQLVLDLAVICPACLALQE